MRIHLKKEQKQLVSEHSDYFFNYFTLGMVSMAAHTNSISAEETLAYAPSCFTRLYYPTPPPPHLTPPLHLPTSPPLCRMCYLMHEPTE